MTLSGHVDQFSLLGHDFVGVAALFMPYTEMARRFHLASSKLTKATKQDVRAESNGEDVVHSIAAMWSVEQDESALA